VHRLSFYNEIEVMVGLRDPNLVQVLGICSRDGDTPSAVLEYADLGDLYQFLVNSIPEQVAPSIINGPADTYNILRFVFFLKDYSSYTCSAHRYIVDHSSQM
jgi:serine/threonine protein kinase